MTLLEKARQAQAEVTRSGKPDEMLEVAMAYISHEINYKQVLAAMGKKSNTHAAMASAVFKVLRSGEFKLVKS